MLAERDDRSEDSYQIEFPTQQGLAMPAGMDQKHADLAILDPTGHTAVLPSAEPSRPSGVPF